MQTCKIGTWNLCQGLANKKDLVKEVLLKEKIDICCVQETDITSDYPISLLMFQGFSLELEKNNLKARVGVYLNSRITYKRRNNLEGSNSLNSLSLFLPLSHSLPFSTVQIDVLS